MEKGPRQAPPLRCQMSSFSDGVAGVRWRVEEVDDGRAESGLSKELLEFIVVGLSQFWEGLIGTGVV